MNSSRPTRSAPSAPARLRPWILMGSLLTLTLAALAADPALIGPPPAPTDDLITQALPPVAGEHRASSDTVLKAALLDAMVAEMARDLDDSQQEPGDDGTSIEDFTEGMTLVNNNLEKEEATFLPLWSDGEGLYLEVPAPARAEGGARVVDGVAQASPSGL